MPPALGKGYTACPWASCDGSRRGWLQCVLRIVGASVFFRRWQARDFADAGFADMKPVVDNFSPITIGVCVQPDVVSLGLTTGNTKVVGNTAKDDHRSCLTTCQRSFEVGKALLSETAFWWTETTSTTCGRGTLQNSCRATHLAPRMSGE